MISPGNGNGSLAQGAIWASEESLSTWFDRWNQWELGALQGLGVRELMAEGRVGRLRTACLRHRDYLQRKDAFDKRNQGQEMQ